MSHSNKNHSGNNKHRKGVEKREGGGSSGFTPAPKKDAFTSEVSGSERKAKVIYFTKVNFEGVEECWTITIVRLKN